MSFKEQRIRRKIAKREAKIEYHRSILDHAYDQRTTYFQQGRIREHEDKLERYKEKLRKFEVNE